MRMLTPWVGPHPQNPTPREPGRLRRPYGGRWDDFEAILNGMFFRWRFAPSHPCIAEVGQPLKPLKKDLGQVKAQPAATRIPEAVHHPENVVFVVEKASF